MEARARNFAVVKEEDSGESIVARHSSRISTWSIRSRLEFKVCKIMLRWKVWKKVFVKNPTKSSVIYSHPFAFNFWIKSIHFAS